MANETDLSLLTTDDYQDYWNQFLRFYADEIGKNFSKTLTPTMSRLQQWFGVTVARSDKDTTTFIVASLCKGFNQSECRRTGLSYTRVLGQDQGSQGR